MRPSLHIRVYYTLQFYAHQRQYSDVGYLCYHETVYILRGLSVYNATSLRVAANVFPYNWIADHTVRYTISCAPYYLKGPFAQ